MSAARPAAGSLVERDARAIAQNQKLRFFPLTVVSARGATLTDESGRELLDLSASWSANGVGHAHPRVVAAIADAAARAPGASILSQVNPDAVALAELLLELVPGSGERRVLLGHAGTDANEAALAAAKRATGRPGVLAFAGSYHGGFGAAKGVSGVFVGAGEPAGAGAVFLRYPGRLPGETRPDAELTAEALAEVRSALAGGQIAAVIVEPLQSDGGIIVPPDGFLAGLADAAREAGTLLICDEVKVGLGRTGALHAFSAAGIEPDLVTLGKSLGGGLPLAAVIGSAALLDAAPASALLTTAGNPVAAAAGRAVLTALIEERLPENAAERGAQLRAGLSALGADGGAAGPAIADVRGRGLSIGVELRHPDAPGDAAAAADLTRRVVFRLWQLGAVCYSVRDTVLELTPPLSLSAAEAERAVALIGRAIVDALAGAVSDADIAPYLGW